MRIFILSAMVAGSMAACTSGNADMIVFSGYANNTKAAVNYTTGTPWAHTDAAADLKSVREIFANTANETTRAASNGNFHGVPWPLSTGGYNSGATSATDFAIEMIFNNIGGTAPKTDGAVCIRLNTAAVTDNTGGSCTAPEFKWYSNLDCVAGEIASPSASAGYLKATWLAAAGTEVAASGLALYGKAQTAAGDAITGHFVTASTFTRVKLSFFTAATCASSAAVPVSATAIATQSLALFLSTDAITNVATIPGKCVNVTAAASFMFYCDVTNGSILHKGFANVGCTGSATTANTTTWARGVADTLTAAEQCIQWKGYTGLYATLTNAAGTALTTSTLMAAVCTAPTTAAPSAAPASGAAAVGTAAAVAAGAAALIL